MAKAKYLQKPTHGTQYANRSTKRGGHTPHSGTGAQGVGSKSPGRYTEPSKISVKGKKRR